MAELKTDKITLPNEFKIDLLEGWTLSIDLNAFPSKYTLTHGKKSMSFNSEVMKKLCCRDYGIRLVRGRTQMIIPAQVLESFVLNNVFIQWYDSTIGIDMAENDKSLQSC